MEDNKREYEYECCNSDVAAPPNFVYMPCECGSQNKLAYRYYQQCPQCKKIERFDNTGIEMGD